MSVSATRATYAVTMKRPKGSRPPAQPIPRAGRTTVVVTAAEAALRCDFLDVRGSGPVASLVRLGVNPPLMVDHGARDYRIVPLPGVGPGGPPATQTGPDTAFGPTVRVCAARGLELWLLEAPRLPALATWWEALFGELVPRAQRAQLPFAYELRKPDAAARVGLQALEDVRVDAATFKPPPDFTLRQEDGARRRVRVPKPGSPRPASGQPRESAIGALLLAGGADERVKLQLRDEVVERARVAVNDLTQRIIGFSGEGMSLALFPTLFDELATAGPGTPAGARPLALGLLIRGTWLHLGTVLKEIFASPSLLEAFNLVMDAAVAGAPVAAIEPDASVGDDDRATFRQARELVGGRGVAGQPGFIGPLAPALVAELNAIRGDDDPARAIDLRTVETRTPGDAVESLARRWFQLRIGAVSLQPDTGLVPVGDGRVRGWVTNGYRATGLGELIDLELDVSGLALELARLAVVFPFTLVDETDARFAAIDANADVVPGALKRSGLATRVRLNELRASGTVTTTPTTRSLVVAALIIFQPHLLPKLFNYASMTIALQGVSADVLVFLEQERLGPAPPTLRVWVSNFRAEGLEVSGGIASGDPLLALIGDLIVNEILDELTPTLIDRLRPVLAAALQVTFGVAEKVLRGLLGGPSPLRRSPEFEAPDVTRGPTTGERIEEELARGEVLHDGIRLQRLLNLDREAQTGTLATSAIAARDALQAGEGQRDTLWAAHAAAATAADVDLPAEGFNPSALTPPLRNRAGAVLAAADVEALQRTFDAWAAQVRAVAGLTATRDAANTALNAFLDGWPEGQTAAEGVAERRGYRLALGICRPDTSPFRQALVHPAGRTSSEGDLTLLISGRQFHELTAATGFDYSGDIRVTDGAPAVLPQLPVLDWWRDARDPGALGARPDDLRDGPPPLPPGPSGADVPDWRAYWSRLDLGGRGATLIPVSDPAPGEHVAEILVGVSVLVLVTTYTAVTVERCGPDLTKLGGQIDRPPLDDLGRFRPPAGPGGPRPRPDDTPLVGVETGFHRVPSALEPPLPTARALEDTRFVTGLEGALFAHPGGPAGAPFAGDAHCEVVTAWDVAAREEWLRARLELRFPVWVGLANAGPFGRRVLAGSDALGARAVLPVFTYRFGLEPLGPGTFTVAADGPLAGLAAGENRAWLQELWPTTSGR